MKLKFLFPIALSIIIGFLFGKIIFSTYNATSVNTFNEGEKLYFVVLGSFSSLEDLKKIDSYESYLSLYEDNKYYLYGGISEKKEIANKIKDSFNISWKNIYIKEKYVNNDSFTNILNEYDKVASIANSNEDLLAIERIVISNYKELILQE